MKQFLIFCCLSSIAFAQFPDENGFSKPWTGPIADHMLGQLVPDTPEVAAAKRQHAAAHSQVLAILPELPPEQRYQMTGLNTVVLPPPHYVPQPQQPLHIHHHVQPQTHFPQSSVPNTPHQLAEEIPRSDIGEVPEVAAARKAHLAAYSQVRAVLPVLQDQSAARMAVAPQYNQQPQQQYQLSETSEVAAARAEHARLFAAAVNAQLGR